MTSCKLGVFVTNGVPYPTGPSLFSFLLFLSTRTCIYVGAWLASHSHSNSIFSKHSDAVVDPGGVEEVRGSPKVESHDSVIIKGYCTWNIVTPARDTYKCTSSIRDIQWSTRFVHMQLESEF